MRYVLCFKFLFLCSLFFTFNSHSQVLECGGKFSKIPAPYPCVEVKNYGMPNNVAGAEVRLFRFDKGWTNRPEDLNSLDQIAEAAMTSMKFFATMGKIPPIDFLFSSEFSQTNEVALAGWAQSPCRVTVFYSFELNPETAKQVIAHEVFHCFQSVNIFLPSGYTERHSTSWWVEGGADYFSNLVYPKANREHEFQRKYWAAMELTHQTTPYSTSLFFQYLENIGQGSPAFLIGELKKQPQNNDFDGAMRALSDWPNIADNFHGFIRAIDQKDINDTGGGKAGIPVLTDFDDLNLKPKEEKMMVDVSPFTMRLIGLIIPPGAKVKLRIDDVMTARGLRVSYKKRKEMFWKKLEKVVPAEIETDCDEKEPVIYDFLFTSTEKKSPSGTVPMYLNQEVEVQNCACKHPTAILDPCITGHWKLDNEATAEALKNYFKGQDTSDAPYEVTQLTVSGEGLMEIKQGGSGNSLEQIANEILTTWTLKEDTSKQNVMGTYNNVKYVLEILQDGPKNMCITYVTGMGEIFTVSNGKRHKVPLSSVLNGEMNPMQYECKKDYLKVWNKLPDGDLFPLWFMKKAN